MTGDDQAKGKRERNPIAALTRVLDTRCSYVAAMGWRSFAAPGGRGMLCACCLVEPTGLEPVTPTLPV
jgi:hypothetical protein